MIREALTEWKETTEKLLNITVVTPSDARDEVIVEIEQLIEKREQLKPFIEGPFTDEEQSFGKELLTIEDQLQKRLAVFSKSIRLDITESQKKKDSVHAYVNPYHNVFKDGTFYDKRK